MAILNVKLPTNLTEYPNSFKRQGSFPLEAYSVFYAIHGEDGAVVTSALDAAKEYARNNPISYVGQILAVVDVDAEGASSVKVYKIENAAGDLIPVGDTAAADAAVEALQEKLDAVETAYKARCAAIEADVEALEAADEAFEQALANIYTKDEVDGFLDAIEESLDNVYTKSEIDGKLAQGQHMLFDVDVVGGLNIKKYYGDRALAVFVQPPSVEVLRERLVGRATDSAEMIEKRLAKAEWEMEFAPKFDVRIVNDNLDEAVAETIRIVTEFLSR